MKKTLPFTAALLLFTASSFAQTAAPVTDTARSAVKAQMDELCRNIKLYNNQHAEANEVMVKGNFTASKAGFAAADNIKQTIKAETAALKSEGVKNPAHLAHKAIKKADQKAIAADVNNVLAAKKAVKAALKAGNTTEVLADENNVKATKDILRKDIKEAKRDGNRHIPFVKNNHLSHA